MKIERVSIDPHNIVKIAKSLAVVAVRHKKTQHDWAL